MEESMRAAAFMQTYDATLKDGQNESRGVQGGHGRGRTGSFFDYGNTTNLDAFHGNVFGFHFYSERVTGSCTRRSWRSIRGLRAFQEYDAEVDEMARAGARRRRRS